MFWSRVPREEGKRPRAYNDATGKTVTCQPGGNLSIGYGINLEVGLDDAEQEWLFRHRAQIVESQLQQHAWYNTVAASVQSVLVDIGYNAGVGGLLHFPHMLSALAKTPPDYAAAAQECRVADERLDAQRYAPLRQIIASAA